MNFSNAVIYQIYPKSFQDSNQDGIGDIPGIISRLDYLAQLGIDYLWLTPIYPSPQKDNGYDISNYYEIDPVYGTMEDFKTLVFLAGKLGIKIIMDMVLTTPQLNTHGFSARCQEIKNTRTIIFSVLVPMVPNQIIGSQNLAEVHGNLSPSLASITFTSLTKHKPT